MPMYLNCTISLVTEHRKLLYRYYSFLISKYRLFSNIVSCLLFVTKLLTGYTELELPETRKRISESGFVNAYPFIFNEYARHGYVSAFNEDLPDFGTFSYRLNGFQEQPTTHFMRPFYLAFQKESSRHKRLCVGDTPRHKVMLDYTQKVSQIRLS